MASLIAPSVLLAVNVAGHASLMIPPPRNANDMVTGVDIDMKLDPPHNTHTRTRTQPLTLCLRARALSHARTHPHRAKARY